jgi:hypothetical protein
MITVILDLSNIYSKIYVDGILQSYGDITDVTELNTGEFDFFLGDGSKNYVYGDTRYYENVAFSDDEVLALYESTKNAVGVRPAERSFTHRLQPDVDDNTVFATDMSTKNSDGTLMDLSW